jgi:hypothetical protein
MSEEVAMAALQRGGANPDSHDAAKRLAGESSRCR